MNSNIQSVTFGFQWREAFMATNPKKVNDSEVIKKIPQWIKLQKWLVLTGLLGMTLIFFGIFYIWLQNQQVQYGYRIAHLQREHEQLLAIQRKLHLEWVRLHEPSYLEKLGRQQLGLAPPLKGQKLSVTP
jgi:hypothetical protein